MNNKPKELAPRVHGKEDAEKVKLWLKMVMEADAEEDPDPLEDSQLEGLLWMVGTEFARSGASWLKDIKFRFDADQWVSVEVQLTYQDDTTECLCTEGDNFLLAMAKTVERLKALAKLKKGQSSEDSRGSTPNHGT